MANLPVKALILLPYKKTGIPIKPNSAVKPAYVPKAPSYPSVSMNFATPYTFVSQSVMQSIERTYIACAKAYEASQSSDDDKNWASTCRVRVQ